MFERLRKIGAWTGFISALGIMLAFLIVGLVYKGRIGESYSLTNHFVSELGEIGVSPMAWLFNAALIIGGIGILLGFVSLALRLHGWFRYLILVLGFITGVSGTLVGFFPMNQLDTHISVALTFFNTGWMITGAFSVYLLVSKQKQFPRWLVLPGFVAAAAFIVFSNYNDSYMNGTRSLDELLGAARPEFWSLAVLEWVVVLSVLIWVVLISAVMIRLESQEQAPTEANTTN